MGLRLVCCHLLSIDSYLAAGALHDWLVKNSTRQERYIPSHFIIVILDLSMVVNTATMTMIPFITT
jgi:hypothetical protein